MHGLGVGVHSWCAAVSSFDEIRFSEVKALSDINFRVLVSSTSSTRLGLNCTGQNTKNQKAKQVQLFFVELWFLFLWSRSSGGEYHTLAVANTYTNTKLTLIPGFISPRLLIFIFVFILMQV